ncbi:MAG: Fic family protein [Bacilli bacterium]|nr:Fic family protein [Bacilli bacterium]
MAGLQKLNLKFENGNNVCINDTYLVPIYEEILEFLNNEKYMETLSFAKSAMLSQEIKCNVTLEKIEHTSNNIDQLIINDKKIRVEERKRIINLYHGYQYILSNKIINQNNLTELYSILSHEILLTNNQKNTGQFYRNKPVYLLKKCKLTEDVIMGVDPCNVPQYMNHFFDYINDGSPTTKMEHFLKSQIMHFYFLYIHPYLDINGRTARTVSMWYLLNNKCYPYVIFNKAIAFAKKEYENALTKGRDKGDITLFLKYILVNMKRELEKEYIIHSIVENCKEDISRKEQQVIHYFLTMNGNLTVKDLIGVYNCYNPAKRPNIVYEENVVSLIEKGIFLNKGYTKGYIANEKPNMMIGLNPDMVNVNISKVKLLSLNKIMY